eukprot:s39_g4.t1
MKLGNSLPAVSALALAVAVAVAMAAQLSFWRSVVHGKVVNVVLPTALILAAVVLLTYCHATADDVNDNSSRVFLGLIVIQMLPLLFLELRLTSCPDPEAMLARFGTKVLLLHGCFMILRVAEEQGVDFLLEAKFR